ncbi:sensor histidine kinase [Occallatibacter savannae]|uniref:sensor histidine kinase n=1 Tax=Occallatibacter savannae TaxID=1002691 RepID=UPI000D68A4FA|nr:HAMP domain-containing sensor histidine kinase [Occallatibacter savannae]
MYSSLMPHAVCWRQDPQLIWTMAVTNAITFLSYFSICITLFYLARKTKRVIVRDWIFFLVGFALFIVACGSTHLMEVITTWNPIFWVDAWTNIVTAVLSGYVALQFIRRAPALGFGINDYADRLANAQTEKAQVEQNLLDARKLEEWNRMSAIVTHEINNPLTAIQNYMYLIQNNPDAPADVKQMAEHAADEVRRIGSIARSTLGFFRQDEQPEETDLQSSARSVRSLLEPTLRQRGIEVLIEATGDCKLAAYSVEIRQVLLNLVRNACEASTRRSSKVIIRIEGRAKEVSVTVEDQGTGIAPEMFDNLFKFGRSTKGERGNGMGLWAVKKLVTRRGGSVSVESTLGKGSRFTVVWPRAGSLGAGIAPELGDLAAAH